MWAAPETVSAKVVVSARVEKGTAAGVAERMGDPTDALAASAAETIIGVDE
jgi:hypothetical protein